MEPSEPLDRTPHRVCLRLSQVLLALALVTALGAAAAPALLRASSPRGAVAAQFFPHQLVMIDMPVIHLDHVPAEAGTPPPALRDPWGHPFLLGPRRGGAPWPAAPDERATHPWDAKVYSCGPNGRDEQGEGDDVLMPAILNRRLVVEIYGVSLDPSARLGPAWRPLPVVALAAGARPLLLGAAGVLLGLALSAWLAARRRQVPAREVWLVIGAAAGPAGLGLVIGHALGWWLSLGLPDDLPQPALHASPLTAGWCAASLLFAMAWRASLPAPGEPPEQGQRRRRLLVASGLVLLSVLALGVGSTVSGQPWIAGRPLSAWQALLAGSSEEQQLAATVLAEVGPEAAPLAPALRSALQASLGRGDLHLERHLAAALGRTGPEGVAELGRILAGNHLALGVLGGLRLAADVTPAREPLLARGREAVAQRRLASDRYLVEALVALGPAALEFAPALRADLLATLDHNGGADPRRTLLALAELDPAGSVDVFVRALAHEVPDVVQAALVGLTRAGPAAAPEIPAITERWLTAPAYGTEGEYAIAVLAIQGQAFDRALLARLQGHEDVPLRAAGHLVASLLADPGPDALKAARRDAVSGSAPQVQFYAQLALDRHP